MLALFRPKRMEIHGTIQRASGEVVDVGVISVATLSRRSQFVWFLAVLTGWTWLSRFAGMTIHSTKGT